MNEISVLSTIHIIVVYLSLIGLLIWSFVLNGRIKNSTRYFIETIKEVRTEAKLSLLLEDDERRYSDIHELGSKLFHQVKKVFGLHARSYAQIVKEIQALVDVDPSLKKDLQGFFTQMIELSYKGVDISTKKKEEIRGKLRTIYKSLPDE